MPTPRIADVTRNKTDPRQGGTHYNVVFIPWELADAQEWIDKTTQWNLITGNKYQLEFYRPGMISRFIDQANDHSYANIYIRGHGAAGVANIQVKVGTPPNVIEKKISITEACDRLIKSGLKKSFAGAIKFFHCYSGTVMTGAEYQNHTALLKSKNTEFKSARKQGIITKDQYNQWKKPILKNKSIARTGADYMRSKGYRRCIYFGYLGPLESEYNDDGNHNWHKFVDLSGLQSPTSGGIVGTQRASLGRVQV